jgi:hypothetical protein
VAAMVRRARTTLWAASASPSIPRYESDCSARSARHHPDRLQRPVRDRDGRDRYHGQCISAECADELFQYLIGTAVLIVLVLLMPPYRKARRSGLREQEQE